MDPRVQDSYDSSGCSPQGFVASMFPSRGVGLAALIPVPDRIDTWLFPWPGGLRQAIKHHLGWQPPGRFSGARINEAIAPPTFEGTHKVRREPDRQIEVGHFSRILLQPDEFWNVGMISA